MGQPVARQAHNLEVAGSSPAGAIEMDVAAPQAGPRRVRPPCRHDSTRGDGWLDTHCLRCGLDGRWLGGVRIKRFALKGKIHPSGKLLLKPYRLLERALSEN